MRKPWRQGAGNKFRVARMLLDCYSTEEMADALGCSVVNANALTREVYADWMREHADEGIRARAVVELRRMEHVGREAADAWERSQQPAKVRRKKYVVQPISDPFGGEGDSVRALVEETVEHRGRDGDPRFLQQYAAAVVERAKMLGVYKDGDGEPTYTVEHLMGFVKATVRALQQCGAADDLVERFKERTLQLVSSGQPAVVCEPDIIATGHDVSGVSQEPEPPAPNNSEDV